MLNRPYLLVLIVDEEVTYVPMSLLQPLYSRINWRLLIVFVPVIRIVSFQDHALGFSPSDLYQIRMHHLQEISIDFYFL